MDLRDAVVAGRFKVTRLLGTVSAITCYQGVDSDVADAPVLIRLETTSTPNSVLSSMYQRLMDVGACTSVPAMLYYGPLADRQVLVTEMPGPSLEDLVKFCGGKLSLKCVLLLAPKLVTMVEQLHKNGFSYSILRPDNIAMGQGSNSQRPFLMDLSETRRVMDAVTNLPLPITIDASPRGIKGSSRFSSLATHKGRSNSRKDDLETLVYVLVYLLKGSLPWQTLPSQLVTKAAKDVEVARLKDQLSPELLCDGCPPELSKHLSYVRSLSYDVTPDYAMLRELYTSLMQKEGFEETELYDWLIPRTMKQEVPAPTSATTVTTNPVVGATSPLSEPERIEATDGASPTILASASDPGFPLPAEPSPTKLSDALKASDASITYTPRSSSNPVDYSPGSHSNQVDEYFGIKKIPVKVYIADGSYRTYALAEVVTAKEALVIIAEKFGIAGNDLTVMALHAHEIGMLAKKVPLAFGRLRVLSAEEVIANVIASPNHKSLLFKKRIYYDSESLIKKGDTAYMKLLFIQAHHSLMNGHFPATLVEVTRLAALRLFYEMGPYDTSRHSAALLGESLGNYVPQDLRIKFEKKYSDSAWCDAILETYKSLQLTVVSTSDALWQYVRSIEQWPLYGSEFFPVKQVKKDPTKSLPLAKVTLAINHMGINLQHSETKQVLDTHPIMNVSNVVVSTSEYGNLLLSYDITNPRVGTVVTFAYKFPGAYDARQLILDYGEGRPPLETNSSPQRNRSFSAISESNSSPGLETRLDRGSSVLSPSTRGFSNSMVAGGRASSVVGYPPNSLITIPADKTATPNSNIDNNNAVVSAPNPVVNIDSIDLRSGSDADLPSANDFYSTQMDALTDPADRYQFASPQEVYVMRRILNEYHVALRESNEERDNLAKDVTALSLHIQLLESQAEAAFHILYPVGSKDGQIPKRPNHVIPALHALIFMHSREKLRMAWMQWRHCVHSTNISFVLEARRESKVNARWARLRIMIVFWEYQLLIRGLLWWRDFVRYSLENKSKRLESNRSQSVMVPVDDQVSQLRSDLDQAHANEESSRKIRAVEMLVNAFARVLSSRVTIAWQRWVTRACTLKAKNIVSYEAALKPLGKTPSSSGLLKGVLRTEEDLNTLEAFEEWRRAGMPRASYPLAQATNGTAASSDIVAIRAEYEAHIASLINESHNNDQVYKNKLKVLIREIHNLKQERGRSVSPVRSPDRLSLSFSVPPPSL